jgi:flagellin
MAIRIFTNLTSLNAQRILGINNARLAQSIERISSGLRINRASDDIGGLAIAESLRSDIRVLRQGLRNLNDGLSLLNVAEAGMNQQSDILIRMRELAAQSASGTITDAERANLQLEFIQLTNEIDRISNATEFNGQKLLDGSLILGAGPIIIHFGLDATVNSFINLNTEADVADLDAVGLGIPSTAAQTANFGGTVTDTGLTGLAAAAFTATVNIDGVDQFITIADGAADASTFADLITEINADLTGATAAISGGNIVVTSAMTGATSSITITDTGLFAALAGFVSFDAAIAALDISTQAGATTALTTLDTSLDFLSGERASLGAVQNRLTRIIPGQAILVENLQAAESQIRDADIAEEVALLARNQILVEAATAMVAQANIIPEQVLKLLPSI